MTATKDEITGKWSLSGVEPSETTYLRMIEMLEKGQNFKFARYGDGELMCMSGKVGQNCDKHQYFPDLGQKLRESVKTKPDYMVGIQPLSVMHLPHLVEQYFSGFELFNADCIHDASINGKLKLLLDVLEKRHVILVGAPHLAMLPLEMVHIVTLKKDCWLAYEDVRQQIEFHIDGVLNPVVVLCASMMTEVLIKSFEDEPITMIDAGSVFDPYCNQPSRSYHFKLKI